MQHLLDPARFHGVGHNPTGGGGLLANVAPDHAGALLAPLLLPLAVWCFLSWVRTRAADGRPWAQRFVYAFDTSPLIDRVASGFLLVAGAIHLGLVPGHIQEAPSLAWLFLLNGLAFTALAIGAFVWRRWKVWSALLLLATMLSYLIAVLRHTEDVDQAGMISLMVEMAALGMVWLPRQDGVPSWRTWFRWASVTLGVPLVVITTGALAWAATMQDHSDDTGIAGAHGREATNASKVLQPVSETIATPEQRAAAAKFAADTKAGIAKYTDVRVALADGYAPSRPATPPMIHYNNPAYSKFGRSLDPSRPENLVYTPTSHGLVLMGAMYQMPRPGIPGPDIGGPITRWHTHPNICIAIPGLMLAGFATPFGNCPIGSLSITTAAMLHVWTIDNPTGPYGDLDPAFVKRVSGS